MILTNVAKFTAFARHAPADHLRKIIYNMLSDFENSSYNV